MSVYRSDPESLDVEKRTVCSSFMHYSWKTITCLFSHVTLISMVISYCYLGAVTFEALEVEHEVEVKKNIQHIRDNTTLYLWNFTQDMATLREENFTPVAEQYLKEFENTLLKAMAKDGWDGEEDPNKVQWTRAGALFYSIVVITTIGYGHITPKTNWGKVVTIFYAILGIPLMLLCLSNIGDIMATSFRFLYWRVCCYVCQKKPKKRQRGRSFRGMARNDSRFVRSRSTMSYRRSMRASGKSADSGYAVSSALPSYHSDTELRYPDEFRSAPLQSRGSGLLNRPNRVSETSAPSRKSSAGQKNQRQDNFQRGGSLDRRKLDNRQKDNEVDVDPTLLAKTPILCNKYVVGTNDAFKSKVPGRRAVSMPKTSNFLEPPRSYSPESSSDIEEGPESIRGSRRKIKPRRSRSPLPNSSPKMMTPLGYGHRNKYLDDPDSDEYEEYGSVYEPSAREKSKPVPIWLCVLLVISYILAGAYLFKTWEGWDYLDAAYFCFITLTTIGFGDLVPAKGVTQNKYHATVSIALCSLYLLFGISLLAMSFNLVQEEVIYKVKRVAKTLGIIKSDSDESEDDD
ncbi:potassium two pore domain channel subfamily K member galene isoform X2 [Rhynchophorus ferrugineus]|uniref:potassium two pore domain channel subfamily K member galene isoform X2 n=1 Tax=Rhynchophorus ferrugineus TaxID=354439 RepID=UPI003FCE2ACD